MADSGGLLLRELELLPPILDPGRKTSSPLFNQESLNLQSPFTDSEPFIWPRKRRLAERDVALGFRAVGNFGDKLGFVGMRRDVVLATWRRLPDAIWHKVS